MLIDHFTNANKIYSLVRQEEKQQDLHTIGGSPEAAALTTQSRNSFGNRNWNNNSAVDNKGGNLNANGGRPSCEHCGKLGHTKQKCFELNGYPPNWRRRGQGNKNEIKAAMATNSNQDIQAPIFTQEQYQKLLAMLSSSGSLHTANLAGIALNSSLSHTWIIDTGATNHMCSSLDFFHSYEPCHVPLHVQLPDGTVAQVTHIGKVSFSPDFLLDKVFYIPSFKFNLLSVSQLTKSNRYKVIFSSNFCECQDLYTKKQIGKGRLREGLFYIQLPAAFSFTSQITSTHEIDLWHWRLGHPSLGRLEHFSKTCPMVSFNKEYVCDICPKAKQTRKPFSISSIKSKIPFELIHCDVWDPFSTSSFSGAHYFLTIVDDYTRCTWLYLMKTKSETQLHLCSFHALIKTQFNANIKIVCSANGTEFLVKELQKFFLDQGIIHQRSCVRTPQQNDVVERKHRHLLEVA